MRADINHKELLHALGIMLKAEIADAAYDTKELQGGTLGDVLKLSGNAIVRDGSSLPFDIVFKTQKKWERPGDHDSWRREHDLYKSGFGDTFNSSFRWPECYHTEMTDDRIHIWMEYIEGISGDNLTVGMLEDTAFETGLFQGRIKNGPLNEITCFGDTGVLKREYLRWHKQTFSYEFLISEECRIPDSLKKMYRENKLKYNDKTLEYNYLRSSGCDIPYNLKEMIMDIDERMDEVFQDISGLPVVLCHRDLWTENIFYSKDNICLIDWDCTGWGYLGEDIASLIADETDAADLKEYYHRFIPAYLKGISESIDISNINNFFIWEMIIIKFGYRIVQEYIFTQLPEIKERQVNILKALYELKPDNTMQI